VNDLAQRAVVALLVAAGGAGGADDNHASTLAAVLVSRHVGDVLVGVVWFGVWFSAVVMEIEEMLEEMSLL
jgi:hypothetical protein